MLSAVLILFNLHINVIESVFDSVAALPNSGAAVLTVWGCPAERMLEVYTLVWGSKLTSTAAALKIPPVNEALGTSDLSAAYSCALAENTDIAKVFETQTPVPRTGSKLHTAGEFSPKHL